MFPSSSSLLLGLLGMSFVRNDAACAESTRFRTSSGWGFFRKPSSRPLIFPGCVFLVFNFLGATWPTPTTLPCVPFSSVIDFASGAPSAPLHVSSQVRRTWVAAFPCRSSFVGSLADVKLFLPEFGRVGVRAMSGPLEESPLVDK
ncbi:hypothetical protein LZ30DRAFT_89118 [Colletotrichum cereale]|nr:hypothetical protein LZ30DRAFT_89118 [Colletotrichum cereale]